MFEERVVHFPGIDGLTPNKEAMTYLWQKTNLTWSGYYLPVKDAKTGALSAASQVWSGMFGFMKSLGWGLAPLYVGKQFHKAEFVLRQLQGQKRGLELAAAAIAEGKKDGDETVVGARKEGFWPPTVLYFDCELPGYLKDAKNFDIETYRIYLKAWADYVRDKGYNAGIYCHQLWADDLRKGAQADYIWAVEYNHKGKPNGDGGYARVAKFAAAHPEIPKKDLPPVGEPFDPSPGLDGTQLYPVDHPNKSGNRLATSWQMAANVQIPYRDIKRFKNRPRITVDMNTSVFKDPGMP